MLTGKGSLLVAMAFSVLTTSAISQAVPPEKANEARVDRLLQQMTLEEKMSLIRGAPEPLEEYQGQAGYLPGVPRLHVPSLRLADGPPGILTRVPAQAETATMGVAATFSMADAEANGAVIGREARSLGIDVVLQPFINMDRDLTFFRGYNTFGEDPFLTGRMGAAEIRGVQAQGVMAQAKHYIGYDSGSFNVFVDEQALHEVYAAPFAAAVEAGVSSIMCSYNRINGTFACGNRDLLLKTLKGELGFKGFVTSDWGAIHDVNYINAGLDMEMPGIARPGSPIATSMHTFFATAPASASPPLKRNEAMLAGMLGGTIPEEPVVKPDFGPSMHLGESSNMRQALLEGTVTEATITAAARRVLWEMDRFGYLDGRQKHSITPQDIEQNAAVIRSTAEHAAVLLKNDAVLPLKPEDLKGLALIGPGAGQVEAVGAFGERSGGLVEREVGPLSALKRMAPDAQIVYAVDDDMTGQPIGAAFLSHNGGPGLVRSVAGQKDTVDDQLDFSKQNHKELPADTAVTWTGSLTVPTPGVYWLYLQVLGATGTLQIDGKEVGRTGSTKGNVHGDIQQATQDNAFPTTDGLDNVRRAVDLTPGPHKLVVSIEGDTSGAPEQVRLAWVTPEARRRDHEAAIAAARTARAAVVFLWTRGKPTFALPGEQDKLVEEVAAVNPRTVVVLNTSQPVAMPWLDKVKGVLEMWWPGDEGGWATADLLLGRANPAGRLPFTWAKRLEDYAASDPHHPERGPKGVDGKTTFSEGLDVGYRWFDKQGIEPLFPFGFGLSYSTFRYSGLKVRQTEDGGLDVSAQIENESRRSGDEVIQVYLGAPENPPDGAQFAVHALAAFDRVNVAAGQKKEVVLHVPPRSLEYWSVAKHDWVRYVVGRTVQVGSSSRDLKLSISLH